MKKVISGGQTGADQGGWLAGKACGIETGGWMPPGFVTEGGKRPEFAEIYGAKEIEAANAFVGYSLRTHKNVEESDGTIRFASDFKSKGEICTLNAIKRHGKPWIDIHPKRPVPVAEVVQWIRDNNINVLNVAGNRESTSPGIKNFTCQFLTEVFKELENVCDNSRDSGRNQES